MSNKLNLYPFCDKWLEKGGSIWIFSDPHFDDPDLELFRKNSPSSEQIAKFINSKCGKNDTLVCLGDVGNLDWVKRLKAGYKVLIMGNHDEGRTKFERIVTKKKYVGHDKCPNCGGLVVYDGPGFNYFNEEANRAWCRECICSVTPIKNYEGEDFDNHLFDEVYDGTLTIRRDIELSHEMCLSRYHFNIHGHDHSNDEIQKLIFKKYDPDLPSKDYINAQIDVIKENNLKHMNCCIEWMGYQLLHLGNFIKSGILKDIPDIHRETIDKASENSVKKSTKL